RLLRISLVVLVIGLASAVGLGSWLFHPRQREVGYTPVQPVPYSHKLHAGDLGLDCRYCHTTVETAAVAAIPPTETCMNCHERVKNQSPALAPIRESYATGKPVPWVRVHRLPDFVFFNHSAHVSAGVSCVSCHGRVDQMIEVKAVEPLNMAWCLDCHRNPAARIRPREMVTNLGWKPDRDPAELGRELAAANRIAPPTHCSGCHR
ncbi:MAG TPA: cytochrome c3 family protein, partial [Bryobacteraceae bacterium]|nr:cytochrome c3 family protein [Bryobacteraceae bacterium]